MVTTNSSSMVKWLKILMVVCLLFLLQTGESHLAEGYSSRLRLKADDDDTDDIAFQHSIGDCSFETDECSYVKSYGAGVCGWRWNWDGNHIDHTYNHTDGRLLSLTTPSPIKSIHGCSPSPKLPSTGGKTRCLTFWFQLTGNLSQSLRVVASRDEGLTNGTKVVWELSEDQDKGWRFGRTAIKYDEPHYVVFEAVPGAIRYEKYTGIVAIDDIIFTEGPCSVLPVRATVQINATISTRIKIITPSPETSNVVPEFGCTFNKGSFCKWNNSETNDIDWNFWNPTFYYGLPSYDHTGKDRGDFIFVKPQRLAGAQPIARLVSPQLVPTVDHCLTFWYYMYGADIDTLNVYFKNGNPLGSPVWSRKRNQGSGWKKTSLNIEQSNDSVTIVFEAHVPQVGDAIIALDDFTLKKEHCPENWMDCDFEDRNLCGYKSNEAHTGWQHQAGSHFTNDSIPSTDHTFNSEYGHYVVLKGASVQPFFQYTLTSPSFASNGYMCLRFWYFMKADTSAFVSVNLKEDSVNYIQHLKGDLEQGDRWQISQTSFTSTASETQIVFSAHTGLNIANVIALDDIEISNGFCGDEADCNMEKGNLCTWSNDPTDDFDWLIGQGRDDNADDDGPDVDHTIRTNDGHYIYFDASKQDSSHVARIYSQTFEHSDEITSRCMHFWYNIQGDSAGTLTVYRNTSIAPQKIWETKQSSGQEWNYAKVPFDGERLSHQLVIEGVVGVTRLGSIAVDDIVISDSGCSAEPEQTELNPQFTTLPPVTHPDGWLPLHELLSCSFQYWSTCNWTQSKADNFDWILGLLNENVSGTPYIPPTNPSDPFEASYMYIESVSHLNASWKAVLSSAANLFEITDVYCIHFNYYMFGSEAGNLTLIVESESNLDPGIKTNNTYWKRVGTQQDAWLEAMTTLKLDNVVYLRLHLIAERGSDGVIAVDGVTVTQGECPVTSLCTFDSKLLCQWKDADDADAYPLRWESGSGVSTKFNGPPVDHTTLTPDGRYQFVSNWDIQGEKAKARFSSPMFDDEYGTHCFKFWYYMGKAGSGSLSVLIDLVDQHAEPAQIWTRPGDHSARWNLAQVSVVMQKGFEVLLEVSFDGKNFQDVIAVDDLELVHSECDKPASCSFDEGPCGYMNDVDDDDFDWLLGYGRTQDPEAIAGPMMDALGTDHGLYMYVDMTRSINTFDKSVAYLRSDLVYATSVNQQFCLEFSYIKLGTAQSDLTVYINTMGRTQDKLQHLWVSPTDPALKWTQITVSFNCTEDFEIIFSASQKHWSNNAFIGIDEIHLTNNPTCQETTPPTNHTDPEASQYYCDFEDNSFCKWKYDETSTMAWTVTQGDQYEVGKPRFDHTTQSYTGRYMFLHSTYQQTGAHARIASPDITKVGQICFKFWYQLAGTKSRLEIALEKYGRPTEVLWTKSGSQDTWVFAQISFTNSHSSNIAIKGFSNEDYSAFMSVDDVEVLLESCPPQKICTFDGDDFCGFDNAANNDFDWTLTARPILDNAEFPLDHTTQTKDDGRYIYINTIGRHKNQYANLVSPMYPPVTGACVKFWFYTSLEFSEFWVHLVGDKNVNLGEYFEGRLTKEWNLAAVPVYPTSYWHVTFQGIVDSPTEVAVAIDDIEINFNDSCSVAEYCDFEKDDCLWHNGDHPRDNNHMNQIDWMRMSAYERKTSNGPSIDHTTSLPTGYFLYSEKSYRDESVLISNVLTSEYQCLSFWYHVNHKGCQLEVWYYGSSRGVEGVRLVTITPQVEYSWQSAVVSLTPTYFYGTDTNILVKIIAKFANGPNIIALDDLMFEKTPCSDAQFDKFQCEASNKTIQNSQVCDFIIDCIWLSWDERNCGTCDFETGDCGYRDISGLHSVEWNITKASDAFLKTLSTPLDHTTLSTSGHYAWTGRNKGGLSKMRSALIQYASSTCHMTFWIYRSPGKVYSNLVTPEVKVNIVTSNGHTTYTIYDTAYSTKYIKDNEWTKALVYIGRVDQPFAIDFGTNIESDKGFVAVDDIKLSQCEFEMISPPCTESDTQFACLSKHGCVPKNRVCDFTADCDDSSDEVECKLRHMNCDFESSFCFWKDTRRAWTRTAGDGFSRPNRDHTQGTLKGKLVKPRYSYSIQGPHTLGGLVLLPSEKCTMRFYYYLEENHSNEPVELRVVTRQYINGEEKVHMKRDRDSGENFFREEITFNETKSFEVMFEAYIGSPYDVLALDDISFDGGCQQDEKPLPVGSTRQPDFCAADEFECKFTKLPRCVKLNQVCDFNDDCQDQTDEEDCGTCTFENGKCGWEDSSAGMYRWKRHQGKDFTSAQDNIPDEDHTTFSTDGWFLLLTRNTAGDSFAASSYLEGPVFGPTGPTCTLSFWYHASGSAGTLTLSLQSQTRNKGTDIAVLESNEHEVWRNFMIVLGEMGPGYKLVFEAEVNEHDEAMNAVGFAIDDVTLSGCSVKDSLSNVKSHDLSCDFEHGLCEWYQDLANDNINWKIGSGSTPTPGTGPEADHTNGKGIYLFIEYRYSGGKYGSLAMLDSPVMIPTDGHCFRFWYHMFGEHVGNLSIVVVSAAGKNSSLIWTQTGSQGNLWRGAMASVVSREPYQIIIFGELGNGQRSAIAIDDISIVPGLCHQFQNAECSFEMGTCGWKTNLGNWILSTAGSVSHYMPPDHTTNSAKGHVMYADLATDKNNTQSELQSEVYRSGPDGSCFHFWFAVGYYFTSDYQFKVTITPFPNDGHFTSEETFASSDASWHYGQLKIDGNENYQVNLITTFSPSDNPHIIVDDFRVTNSSCLEYGSCDFESNWCGWVNADKYVAWLRNSGSTISEYTGPSADHTRGSQGNQFGYYVFVDASSGDAGDKAIMRSPVLRSGPTVCFSAYYHMLGENTGTLSIYVASMTQKIELFSTEGDHGGAWNPLFIEIHNLKGQYWLEIEVKLSGGAAGDIAVDDLLVEPDECKESHIVVTTPEQPTTTTIPKCLSNQASCGGDNPICVPNFMWCDDGKDCPNGEDEKNCDDQHKCPAAQFPCKGKENKCIPAEKICDGIVDCEETSLDESICHSGCFDGFCVNDGVCTNQTTNTTLVRPVCSCGSGSTGYRCQSLVSTDAPENVSTASNGWIAGVVILIVIIILGIVFLVQRKCFGGFNFRRRGDQNPIMMENPTYEFPTNQTIQLSELTPEARAESFLQPIPPNVVDQTDEGHVNPLYDERPSAETSSEHPAGTSAEHPAGASAEHPAGTSAEHPTGASVEHPAGASAEHPAGASVEH